jgi:D-3-phosphoglycerate dehydrogenase
MLAQHEANVEGQVLVTRDHLGYLLTDVSVDYAPEVVHALEAMAETVRLRVLS